jgi:hypothetical protein
MVELGELEDNERQFAAKRIRVVVISDEELETARITQADFPHLVVVPDADQTIAKAMEVIHKGAGRDGSETNAPTTFLVVSFNRTQRLHTVAKISRAATLRSLLPLGIYDADPQPFSTSIRLKNCERNGAEDLVKSAKKRQKAPRLESVAKSHNHNSSIVLRSRDPRSSARALADTVFAIAGGICVSLSEMRGVQANGPIFAEMKYANQ